MHIFISVRLASLLIPLQDAESVAIVMCRLHGYVRMPGANVAE